MSSQQTELHRQLDEAKANAMRLKNEHQAHLHVIANSPTRGKRRQGTAQVQAKEVRQSVANSVSMTTESAPKSRIPAYRPRSGADEEGHGEEEIRGLFPAVASEMEEADLEVDELPISRHVQEESRVERIPVTSMATVEVMNTPLFLTKKKKVMHCELDEPGRDIPFPKNRMKRGFFQRLFGCFHRPSIYSPPRVTSHRPRPPSSGMVPMLTLETEVAPLRSSLAAEKESEGTVEVAEQAPLALQGMHHEAVTVEEVSVLPVCEVAEVTREAAYSNRLLKKQETAMASKIPPPPRVLARSRSQSPVKRAHANPRPSAGPCDVSALPSAVHSSRLSTHSSPIRMTKAQRLREQANLKKIQERNVAESAHLKAMPRAVRRSFLPQLRESLNASTFDQAKRDSIAIAAAQVLAEEEDTQTVATVVSAASERNPMDQLGLMSFSLSDDPFYRELAKIDHSLTPEDLDKLRDVLASSNLELWKN